MVNRARIGVKFFTIGLIVGLLAASRSGAETRAWILSWLKRDDA